ncbi:M23 family metallopeptidase [Hyalangium rubrum]|uniref:M23 family metallopeptidase n=1 Tax=Hyalangium rubrum TaxID=3103134 RepID=A0ABU5HH58_9BACT|nr:M23 family metallopeptidase [Hyalangium sp. s54d21]MDY7232590.1 M23 family metallopeptidase [Hyalangium sp. s54d21]
MAGRGFSRAGLALLLVLGAAGCAGSRASARPEASEEAPPPVKALAAPATPAKGAAAVPIPLRAAHPEPELISVRHRVARGETLFRIARTYGVTVEDLSAANGIKDARGLSVGQELLIPTGVAEVEEPHSEPDLEPVSEGKGPPVASRENLPPRPRPPARPGGTQAGKGTARPAPATRGMLDWPLRGVLYGRFGKKGKEPHDGIDLAAPAGTPVKTAQEGEILFAGEQQGYGLLVIVQHPNGLITLYAHNRDLRVKTGQSVRRSQVIATVGESGRTSGPHLHFEVRVGGKPVEPLDYLGPLPSS